MRIAAILLCLALASPAHAQQHELKGGMNYIVVKRPDAPVVAPVAPQETGQQPAPESQYKAIWNKYKSLAAGQNNGQDNEGTTQPPAPQKASQTTQNAATPAPASTGLTGIIEQYRRNKEQQSQMKTLTMPQPETKTLSND